MNAVFLDRDGTLIVDPPDLRVDSIKKLQLFPETLDALSRLAQMDFGIFIITNQAGIAEGRLTELDLRKITHSQGKTERAKTVLSERKVAIATLKEEKQFAAGQIWPGDE